MSEEAHVIHKKIGEILRRAIPASSSLTLLQDVACGGKQHIPLFCRPKKSRINEYCNVDMLVLKHNRIKGIIEIEESNVKPTQICGKFLPSALSKYYIHESEGNKLVEMADSVVFIQIVDTSKLKRGKTAKFKQWKALEDSINCILPVESSHVKQYKLLTSDDLGQLDAIIRDIS
jgi:hypothetical protein